MAALNMTGRFTPSNAIAGAVILALALSGCAIGDPAEAARMCQGKVAHAWDECIAAYNAQIAALGQGDAAAQRQSNMDTGAVLLLGATAFANGYTSVRPVTTTCFTTGIMTQCTSP